MCPWNGCTQVFERCVKPLYLVIDVFLMSSELSHSIVQKSANQSGDQVKLARVAIHEEGPVAIWQSKLGYFAGGRELELAKKGLEPWQDADSDATFPNSGFI